MIVARQEITDALARLEEQDCEPVTSRAGAAVVRDAEKYLAFWAEVDRSGLSELPVEEVEEDGPCCVRCGRSTPWRMYECPGCRGLR